MKLTRLSLLAALLAVLLCGCSDPLQRLRVEELTAFRRYGWTGMDLTLRVHNGGRRSLALSDARLTLWYGGGEAMRFELRGTCEVAGRTDAEVGMRWRTDLRDPAAGYLIDKKMREGALAAFAVTFSGRLCRGGRCREISLPMMPLSDFLAIFGLSLADLQNQLRE